MPSHDTSSRSPRPAKPAAEPGSVPWHPSAVEFTRGVEVTEVMDSLPAELLELFNPPAAPTAR